MHPKQALTEEEYPMVMWNLYGDPQGMKTYKSPPTAAVTSEGILFSMLKIII